MRGVHEKSMFTVYCYDPLVMDSVCLNKPIPPEVVQPMIHFVCEDAVSAAAVFYELFDLVCTFKWAVQLYGNTIQIQLPVQQGTEQLFWLLQYLIRHYKVLSEENVYENGIVYSTTCWMKIPVSVKGYQYTIPK